MLSTASPDDHHHHSKKKRVGKACDLCRIKKTKCDGKKPCSRCISDNKLCAFTEKKKHKDKAHPSGYIELLETRLDLLTKLLEKIVHLAEPHLPFLHELMANARADHSHIVYDDDAEQGPRDLPNYVPVNEVVAYLILDMGLLDNVPLEWERGAHIAATLSSNNVTGASQDFANHKIEVEDDVRLKFEDDDIQLTYALPPRDFEHSRTSSLVLVELPANGYAGLITEQLNLDDISLGGFSNPKLQHPQSQMAFGFDSFPKRANSLFINTNNDVALLLLLVSLLTNRLELHELEPLRRLPSVKGPMSPSHQKMKMNGHVHKTRPHLRQNSQSVLNNGNIFHFPKTGALTLLLPDFVSTLSKLTELGFFDDFTFDDLPSRAFDGSNLQRLNMLDDPVDELIVNNPFLK